MQTVSNKINSIDWSDITSQMNGKGYAILKNLISVENCGQLVRDYNQSALYRKTIRMEQYRFGLGEYKYFNYPLPGIIQAIRENLYTHLAPIANQWMHCLGIGKEFPPLLEDMQAICHTHGQKAATVLILKYGTGGYNTLHQDIYGEVFFPIQAVLFLNEPGEEYNGGEFILTEQVPRAQSKAIVLQPRKGDILLFTTNFRPVKGSRGYYRANMKHGVSEIREGQRHTLGIIFHEATG